MAAPRPRPDPLAQLALVPLRNAAVRVHDESAQRLVLEIATVYPSWLGPLPRLLGARRQRRYALDGLALDLWRRIDDRQDLGGLIDALAAAEQLSFNEARLLTLHWLHTLADRGLVMLGDRPPIPSRPAAP